MTVNRFRRRRCARLSAWLKLFSQKLGRPVSILDVGGRPLYWENLTVDQTISRIVICNLVPSDFIHKSNCFDFEEVIGDATSLSSISDGAFDVYHANSVIEHVGAWPAMERMVTEARRVALAGWIQTPAWEFPFEPHLRTPFVHWFGAPVRRKFMRNPPWLIDRSFCGRRAYVDSINLISRNEFAALLPGANIWTERFLGLPKSYVASWEHLH